MIARKKEKRNVPAALYDALYAGMGSQQDAVSLIAGIQKYYAAEPVKRPDMLRPVTPIAECLLYRYDGKNLSQRPGPPVLLVPSVINKHTIFDLLPEHSFMGFLAAQGFSVYLLDWQSLAVDRDAGDMVTDILLPAVRAVREDAGAKPSALGYCLGGTLLAGAASVAGEDIASCVFLAAPWNFAADQTQLANYVRHTNALLEVQNADFLPHKSIQLAFAAHSREKNRDKFIRFHAMPEGSDESRKFVAVEDWLNDGVDMPHPLAKTVFCNWYRENDTYEAHWNLENGMQVNAADIKIASFIVASENDQIVPLGSALPLADQVEGADKHLTNLGHIGLMASSRAPQTVWQDIAAWLSKTI